MALSFTSIPELDMIRILLYYNFNSIFAKAEMERSKMSRRIREENHWLQVLPEIGI